MPEAAIRIAALYQFAAIADPAVLREPLLRACRAAGVRGTLLLAAEGINGTIAGSPAGIDAVLGAIRALPGCAGVEVKFAAAAIQPFHRMKVRVKPEIVTMGMPDLDPLAATGTYIGAAGWNALIAEPGTILIDTRNDYEVAVGSFAGAINPATASFRDFPTWFRAERARLLGERAQPRVAMFCTGGIRCEKATAFLKSEGVADVFHLQGGILKYLETMPAEDSRWHGECFVFDARVTVGHGLVPGSHSLCHACRRPVSAEGRASPLYEDGVSCAACHSARSEAQRARYRERHRQEALATARGEAHVGAVMGEDS